MASLELPGGVVDPADASPVGAATCELQEETGFAGTVQLVHTLSAGEVYRLHLMLVSEAVKVSDPTPDDTEETRSTATLGLTAVSNPAITRDRG
jgi:8-oxo-dGTP pyrophosphatase MutT (NUDIX family)